MCKGIHIWILGCITRSTAISFALLHRVCLFLTSIECFTEHGLLMFLCFRIVSPISGGSLSKVRWCALWLLDWRGCARAHYSDQHHYLKKHLYRTAKFIMLFFHHLDDTLVLCFGNTWAANKQQWVPWIACLIFPRLFKSGCDFMGIHVVIIVVEEMDWALRKWCIHMRHIWSLVLCGLKVATHLEVLREEPYHLQQIPSVPSLRNEKRKKKKLRRQWKPLPTLIKEKEPLWYRVL